MPPRFIDASVFVHAYLRPRRALRPDEERIKKRARAIVTRLGRGEPVVLSVVHFCEVANLLEDWMPLGEAAAIQLGLATTENIRILPVTRNDLLGALALAAEAEVGSTDALAVVLMRQEGATEVYSFDRDFDRFDGIHRVAV